MFAFTLGTDNGLVVQRVMGYIQSGKQEGATVYLGGERHGDRGYYIQPTIFTDCKPNMKIMNEEIFGPVAVIIKFKDEEGKQQGSCLLPLPV